MLEVTCAIIVRNTKILLTQNGNNSDHPFQWEFPGGKMKKGENEEECIKREIQEELELKVEIIQTMKRIIHDYGFKKIELIPYLCIIKSGVLILKEHHSYYWANLHELKEFDFSDADRNLFQLEENRIFLEEYIGKQKDDA